MMVIFVGWLSRNVFVYHGIFCDIYCSVQNLMGHLDVSDKSQCVPVKWSLPQVSNWDTSRMKSDSLMPVFHTQTWITYEPLHLHLWLSDAETNGTSKLHSFFRSAIMIMIFPPSVIIRSYYIVQFVYDASELIDALNNWCTKKHELYTVNICNYIIHYRQSNMILYTWLYQKYIIICEYSVNIS
jgi:hypothetical protein